MNEIVLIFLCFINLFIILCVLCIIFNNLFGVFVFVKSLVSCVVKSGVCLDGFNINVFLYIIVRGNI